MKASWHAVRSASEGIRDDRYSEHVSAQKLGSGIEVQASTHPSSSGARQSQRPQPVPSSRHGRLPDMATRTQGPQLPRHSYGPGQAPHPHSVLEPGSHSESDSAWHADARKTAPPIVRTRAPLAMLEILPAGCTCRKADGLGAGSGACPFSSGTSSTITASPVTSTRTPTPTTSSTPSAPENTSFTSPSARTSVGIMLSKVSSPTLMTPSMIHSRSPSCRRTTRPSKTVMRTGCVQPFPTSIPGRPSDSWTYADTAMTTSSPSSARSRTWES